MTATNFDPALAHVLAFEGGFVNHPLDPGGATNLGITRATLARARGRPVTIAHVRALTRTEAASIYRRFYWNVVRADDLPGGLDLAAFDLAVNAGPVRAARLLQRALGVPQDGVIGPRTLAAARAAHPIEAIAALTRARLGFLHRLATWRVFGRGWGRRVAAVELSAFALARASTALPPSSTQKGSVMTDTKSVLTSRTVWANVIGLAALALGLLGFNTGSIDANGLADAAVQIIAAASFIASTIFRVVATKQLAP